MVHVREAGEEVHMPVLFYLLSSLAQCSPCGELTLLNFWCVPSGPFGSPLGSPEPIPWGLAPHLSPEVVRRATSLPEAKKGGKRPRDR